MRSRPGKHLTREGVDLARAVGANLGDFDLVVTSDLPRAIETAIAMGYASDRQVEDLGSVFGADKDGWRDGCAEWWQAMQQSNRVRKAARKHADLLREIAASLPEDGRALVVSHGGVIELGVIGLLPDHDYSGWAETWGYCEGVRLHFEGATCTAAGVLRLSELTSPS